MTIFVFDSGPLIDLFRHYYRARFPTLWRRFDRLVEDGRVTSTREVRNELRGRASLRERRRKADRLAEWCDEHASLFPKPSVEELAVVREILEVPHHRALISRQKSLHGGPVADPFRHRAGEEDFQWVRGHHGAHAAERGEDSECVRGRRGGVGGLGGIHGKRAVGVLNGWTYGAGGSRASGHRGCLNEGLRSAEEHRRKSVAFAVTFRAGRATGVEGRRTGAEACSGAERAS